MKIMLHALMAAFIMCSAIAAEMELRIIGADIPQHKPSGAAWDRRISGVPNSHLPDPYVLVYINGELVFKSRVVDNTLTPRWNIIVPFTSYYRDDVIELHIYDADADWGALALQLRGIELQGHLRAIQENITGDDPIFKGTYRLAPSSYDAPSRHTLWMIEDEKKGVHFEVRPRIPPQQEDALHEE